MCRSRSVGSRVIPNASAISWPCAHVSMMRAVAMDMALMGGPNQGSLTPGATSFRAPANRRRPSLHCSMSNAGEISAHSAAAPSIEICPDCKPEPMAAKAAGSPLAAAAASKVTLSVHARCPIWRAMLQPGAGVGMGQFSAGMAARISSKTTDSASRSVNTPAKSTMFQLRLLRFALTRIVLCRAWPRLVTKGVARRRTDSASM